MPSTGTEANSCFPVSAWKQTNANGDNGTSTSFYSCQPQALWLSCILQQQPLVLEKENTGFLQSAWQNVAKEGSQYVRKVRGAAVRQHDAIRDFWMFAWAGWWCILLSFRTSSS